MNEIKNKTENLEPHSVSASNSTGLLSALEALIKNTNKQQRILICYDQEDGFWLANVDPEVFPMEALDDETIKNDTIEDAIRSAAKT